MRGSSKSYPAVDQKPLKPPHPALHQRQQLRPVPGHDAPPERDVDPALAPRCVRLRPQPARRRRRRHGVQRHVHDGGDAPGGGCARARVEALPLGAPGLVEVDVGVDEAGEEEARGVVDVEG